MKRIFFILSIAFLSGMVCFAGSNKPTKLAKLIYFDGPVVKKKPVGHGRLILDRSMVDKSANYRIEGDFSDDKISNAVFYLNGEPSEGKITGDFIYTIDEKESSIALTLDDVTFSDFENNYGIDSLEHINLGLVVMGKYRSSAGYKWGMGFLQDNRNSINTQLPYTKYPQGLVKLVGNAVCTRNAVVEIIRYEGKQFFKLGQVIFTPGIYRFSNGATYRSIDDESGVYETPGSDVLQVKFENKLLLLKNNSIIQLKDKSTLKITNWKILNVLWGDNTKLGKWDIEVDGEITFTDGSKYNGTLLLSQLSRGQYGWGMTVYNYFKNTAPKDLYLFYGKLVSSQGTVTEYVQNKTREEFKAENEARLLAEAKAQAEAEAEKARKEEQERASGHNGMTTEMLQSGNRSQQSFVNHIYYGVMHSNAEEYMEAMMSIHFLSNNTCRMKLTTKVKGSDDIPTLQIVQMMLEAQGENEKEDVFEYIFRNGTIIFKNTTDRFKVLNGGKELRWYIESNDKLAKKFYAILKRIK